MQPENSPASRSKLLEGFSVVVKNSLDQQYEIVLSSCGARVYTMYLDIMDEESREQSLRALAEAQLAPATEDPITWCVFHDDSRLRTQQLTQVLDPCAACFANSSKLRRLHCILELFRQPTSLPQSCSRTVGSRVCG